MARIPNVERRVIRLELDRLGNAAFIDFPMSGTRFGGANASAID